MIFIHFEKNSESKTKKRVPIIIRNAPIEYKALSSCLFLDLQRVHQGLYVYYEKSA